jgi:hypothetical protein
MALLNFPTNPTNGQLYTIGTNTWIWNATLNAWVKYNNPVQTIPILTVTNSLFVTTSTQSTSSTTGAVIVTGGVGIGGNLNVAGNLSVASAGQGTAGGSISAGTITASSGTFATLNVTSTTNSLNPSSGALVVKGGVGIGGNLWIGGQLHAGGGLVLTTASFNDSLSAGTDISITQVGGNVVRISNTSTLQTVTTRGNTTDKQIKFTNTATSTSTTTGAILVSGGVAVNKDVYVNGNVYASNLMLVDAMFASNQVSVNTTATTVIDSYALSSFRSAKYIIQVDDGVGAMANFEVVELLMMVDNAGNIYITEYGRLTTGAGSLGDYSADIQGDNIVRLYITPFAASNKIVNVVRTALVV